MSPFIRRHLSYANVVATMALVFALAGSAFAAKHYLITSTREISPNVLKKLRGKTGPAGPQGQGGKEGPISRLSDPEAEKLLAVLPYIKYVASGVGGKPTIQFSGANVQVVSGGGKTEETNGVGNLIIGYDEIARMQTGSNNLVLGAGQEYTSYGAVLGGAENTASGPFSDVFGLGSHATGALSSVSGGRVNTASGGDSSVSGGFGNEASNGAASVSGGYGNVASGGDSSVLGGKENKVETEFGVFP